MAETSGSAVTVSTKLERIAKLATEIRDKPLTTLFHHVDLAWMREAYARTRKDGAPGIDQQTAEEYAKNLEKNLLDLLDRARSGERYRAPPVRRVYIPKGDGSKTRPIGIPTFEDKVLQRAVAMLLEAVYEPKFSDVSYGFRPGRSAHMAGEALFRATMDADCGWILEVDIKSFFDTLDHAKLREILSQRVGDGVVLRLIGKWLNAGVMEGSQLTYPEAGTPQGGVISPLLANIYLHEVLDEWFAREVQPRLSARSSLVRYADDFVMVFASEADARKVYEILPKRFGKYGLTLHPEKTRLVPFRRPGRDDGGSGGGPGTFDFLGFTYYWGVSRKGRPTVRQKTAKDRLSRTLKRLNEWLRTRRHLSVDVQQRALSRKLTGHYAYFAITGNLAKVREVFEATVALWHRWLCRRSQRAAISWEEMKELLRRHPLPRPRIVHGYAT